MTNPKPLTRQQLYQIDRATRTFPARLNHLLTEHNLSRQGLADTLNVSRGAVARWLREPTAQNHSSPSTESWLALSHLFQVSLDWLVAGEGE